MGVEGVKGLKDGIHIPRKLMRGWWTSKGKRRRRQFPDREMRPLTPDAFKSKTRMRPRDRKRMEACPECEAVGEEPCLFKNGNPRKSYHKERAIG